MSQLSLEQLAILAELEKRSGLLVPKALPQDQLLGTMFQEQMKAIQDLSKFKALCCSRRSGKTEELSGELLIDAASRPHSDSLYITLSRTNAKKIFWPKLKRMNTDFGFGGVPNESDLSLTLPNKHTIYVTGSPDSSKIENFRGMALTLTVIDEAQAFRSFLVDLIDEIIIPASYDYNGRIIMAGTPNSACFGTFFDACHNRGKMKGWSHHHWTIQDNPYILKKSGITPEAMIQAELKRKGITEDDPSHLRENRGLWVRSEDTLVYKYSDDRNLTKELPTNLRYMFGLDLGFNDQDALVVVGYRPNDPVLYIVDCFAESKMDISALAAVIHQFKDKYNPTRMIMDCGALGKKIAEELIRRFSLPIEAADKARKAEYIELMNDAFRTSMIKVKEGLPIIEEWKLLQWEYSNDKTSRWEDPSLYNHMSDSALYVWRESLSYLHKPISPAPEKGSLAWNKREEDWMMQETLKELNPVDPFDQADSDEYWDSIFR